MSLQGIAASDFQSLNELKVQARTDSKSALPEVAKQFEAIFLQSMLKTMRMGQHFLDESSPFNGKNQQSFQEMLDGQYSKDIAETRGIGLAEVLAKQLDQTAPEAKPSTLDGVHSAINIQDKPAQLSPSIDHFVKSIWPMAKQAASVIGLDPKLLVAQAALETGWGKHVAKDSQGNSSYNLFNIKASEQSAHESVQVRTTEYIANTPIKTSASFRKYDSVEHSFNDYISLIKGSERYQSAVANASNPESYVNELHKAGYATDPAYGSKILKIYRGDELNQAIERCGDLDAI